jgi:hypothetical protein
VLVLQTDMWAVAVLNGWRMVSIPLAKTGDSDHRQILSEYTLVARNEKSSGGVFDLTTSQLRQPIAAAMVRGVAGTPLCNDDHPSRADRE